MDHLPHLVLQVLAMGARRGDNKADAAGVSIVGGLYMRPSISEFSYGFAIAHEFAQYPKVITAVPVFPSLRAEGQRGGGWDVKLDRPGTPLFLQFKLCDQMTRTTCREARQEGFNLPCYRMHLRSARSSQQHQMLLDLEAQNQAVYYCAPMFHQLEELNQAFLRQLVRARSIWIQPNDIGPLRDDADHHLSFEPGGRRMLFSEPRRIEPMREFEDVETHLINRLHERSSTDLSVERLEDLADAIARLVNRQRNITQRQRENPMAAAGPLQRVAYYASVFLESQLFVIQEPGAA